MQVNARGRCVVVGHGPLALQSLSVLHRAGFQLAAVISPDPALRDAGGALGAISADHRGERWPDLIDRIGPFEYLFSIVNFAILPPELLAAARTLAINLHDGPLPRYAGLNAPFWALWNGEHEHGVTWHVMVPEVDAGDVIVQRSVPIGPTDTSYTLHLKLLHAALRSLHALVEAISTGTLERTPQDLSGRSFFAHDARPRALGLLDFELPARDLARHVRALDFAGSENRLGVARLCAGGRFFVIDQASATDGAGQPGTLLETRDGNWLVATSQGALQISQLIDRHGVRARPCEAAPHMMAGSSLLVSTDLRSRLELLDQTLVRGENFWRRRLATEASSLHGRDRGAGSIEGALDGRAPDAFVARCLDRAAAALGVSKLRISYQDLTLSAQLSDLDDLVMCKVPLDYDRTWSFAEVWARVRRCPMYLHDLILRSPGTRIPPPPALSIACNDAEFRIETETLGPALLEALVSA